MRSLRSRLFVLWALSLAASVAVGAILLVLYRQSSTARLERAEAEVASACGAIGDQFGFYATGWGGPAPGQDDAAFAADLLTVVTAALLPWPGMAGGVWRDGKVATASFKATPDVLEAIGTAADDVAAGGEERTARVAVGGFTTLLHVC